MLFADQVSIRLLSQLINVFSRFLQKLLKYFNGTITSTFFVSLLPVSLAIIPITLNKSVSLPVKSTILPLSSKSDSSL